MMVSTPRPESVLRTADSRSSMSKADISPCPTKTRTIWIVFNGEIYNFEELNRRYLSSGHTFRTRSDTETIVHLYEELGEACFAELRGMFAMALWDGRRKRLLLARDRIGKKPLFYSWNGQRLVFGSEIKALWKAGGISAEMDREALSDYFSSNTSPRPRPSTAMSANYARPTTWSSMRPAFARCRIGTFASSPNDGALRRSNGASSLLEEYRTAVESRLISDVPLGAFLSGGVDSSSVVALMNEFQPPVTTCSIGFTEQRYDEAARGPKLRCNSQRQSLRTYRRATAIDLVPKLAWHYDEPFADSSAVPTYYVSQVARQHVTVALSGDGGDENFAGYRRYKLTMWEDRLRSRLPHPVAPRTSSGLWGSAIRNSDGLRGLFAPNRPSRASPRDPDRRLFPWHLLLSAGYEKPAAQPAICSDRSAATIRSRCCAITTTARARTTRFREFSTSI